MHHTIDVEFAPLSAALERTVVLLSSESGLLGATAAHLNSASGGALERAIAIAEHKGKAKTSFEVLAPAGLDAGRVLVLGIDRPASADEPADHLALGGYLQGVLQQRRTSTASLVVEVPQLSQRAAAEMAADLAAGALLRAYEFKKYVTRKSENGDDGEARDGLNRLRLHCADPEAASAAFQRRAAVAGGVMLARDLVNEPANELGPVEFADRLRDLTAQGVEVEILDVPALEALGMRALLGVAQGSVRPARVAVMQWHGSRSKRTKPLCVIGKGVVFDTGGISIKPAAGMEDMKGDMGGAACVAGLMLALAARRAPVNVVGIVGLVENMPSGTAQRPGDIVRSMAGLTIEVLNTDAEGRLVLADLLHYAADRFKPKLMINLATLTGAIMVALGKEYAGLFANDDKLAEDLAAAGEATGERVWRMPLAKAYDKLIDSKNADVKNIGGRFAGAVTAAQFLQRFVPKDVPWAHLDIAGVAMDSGKTEISQGWASGWGVRLLDRLIADKHERGER